MYIMEDIYKTNLETSLSKSIPDIVAYSTIGFISCSIFENILPVFNLKKDSISILLEIFAQLIMITFVYMFISTKISGRYSIVIFSFIVFACQPTLVDKINLIQDRFFKSKILQTEETEKITVKEQNKENTTSTANTITKTSNTAINTTANKTQKSTTKGATSINNLPLN